MSLGIVIECIPSVLDDTNDNNSMDFESTGSPSKTKPAPSAAPPSSSKKSRKGRRESRAAARQSLCTIYSESSGSSNESTDGSNVANGLPEELDGTNLGHVNAFIQDLTDQVDSRCSSIRKTADTAVMALRSALQVALMRIPKNVRKMTLEEFEEEYGGSLLEVARGGAEQQVERALGEARGGKRKEVPSTPGGARELRSACKAPRYGGVGATPMKGCSGNDVPQTPATVRAPRRGEMVLSVDGSPLAQQDQVLATVKKMKKEDAASIALEMDTGDGTFLNIAAPGAVEQMDEEMKETAKSKLKNLQDEVAALMAQLGA